MPKQWGAIHVLQPVTITVYYAEGVLRGSQLSETPDSSFAKLKQKYILPCWFLDTLSRQVNAKFLNSQWIRHIREASIFLILIISYKLLVLEDLMRKDCCGERRGDRG